MTAPDFRVDYQRLFHLLPGNYLLLAPDGTVLDNSDAHAQVSLLPRAQAVGRNIFAAYPSDPQSQADLAASHEVVRKTKQPHAMPLLRYDLERSVAQGGGTEERYWQITHYPIFDNRGELQYILQIPQDVTEATLVARRAAEAQRALNDATEHNRFILESLPLLVWTTRPDGTVDFFNTRWTDFTGRPLADTLGWGWVADLHPDDVPPTTARWEAARQHGTSYQAEYRIRRHDGSYRWHLATGVPRLGPDGQIQMWVGCNADIHEQRQMVEELLEANEQQAALSDQAYQQYQKTESQRETYHSLFMQAPAAIGILRGPNHHHEFVNPPYQQFFADRQLLGRSVAEALPEIAEQGFIALLDHVYQTGETYHGIEAPVQLPGRDRPAYFNSTYQQFRENGQPAGIMVFSFEVTDLVYARQALEQLRQAGPTPPLA